MSKHCNTKSGIKICTSGAVYSEGIYVCLNCGLKVYVDKNMLLSKCSKCGCNRFTISKLF